MAAVKMKLLPIAINSSTSKRFLLYLYWLKENKSITRIKVDMKIILRKEK